jgi:hypothetical protein
MSDTNNDLISSRRMFLGMGAAALVAAGIGCNSKPSEEVAKTQPSGGAGASPGPPTKAAKELTGTASNAALSKEYVQMVGKAARAQPPMAASKESVTSDARYPIRMLPHATAAVATQAPNKPAPMTKPIPVALTPTRDM